MTHLSQIKGGIELSKKVAKLEMQQLNKRSYLLGNNEDETFIINHDLNDIELVCNLIEVRTGQIQDNQVARIYIIDSSTIKVEFLIKPQNNSYKLIIIS